jgi:predicted TIM-barrel fold metal-dependent hydrolase
MKPIPGPDPHPIKPSYQMPAGACDAHCHIFGPASKFPYSPTRSYTPPDAPKEALRALHAHLGISRVVLVQASCHGPDNSAMLDAIADSNGTYRGVGMARTDVSDRELQVLHDGGVRALRFNFVQHLGGAPDVPAVERLIARIAPMGWHAVLHLDAEDIGTYRQFLDNIPCPFVIDHMGRPDASAGLDQPAFRQMLELMRDERVWVKVSGAERVSRGERPFLDAVPYAAALIKAAPDRVLWGTDWPHPNSRVMPNDGQQVDLFARFTDDEAVRRKILVDNPTRLYWAD